MTTPKTPTPQGISALLRKAGFEKSVSRTTRVRGWHSHSWGFVAQRGVTEGIVTVRHEDGMFSSTAASHAEAARYRARYAEVIAAAGYAVEDVAAGIPRLIVRAKAEEA